MSKSNKLLLVIAAALVKDKKILFQQRTADKSMPFLWELPGGKIKINESPETALSRELFEELGIHIRTRDLIPFTFVSYCYPDFHLLMPVYVCRKWEGNIFAKEKQLINFYSINELMNLKMLEADKVLIHPLKKLLS